MPLNHLQLSLVQGTKLQLLFSDNADGQIIFAHITKNLVDLGIVLVKFNEDIGIAKDHERCGHAFCRKDS